MDKLALAQNVIVAAKTAQGIMEIPEIKEMWVERYQQTQGRTDGVIKFENEKLLFLKAFQTNPKLDKLDPFSKYVAFFDLCTSGLTLADGNSYILSMDNKTAVFFPSWKGRLEQIRQMPQVKFCYEPEVVYDCDEFKITRNGPIKTIEHVSHEEKVTKDSKIVHVYMYVEFADGRIIPYEMKAFDVENIRNTRSKSYKSYINSLSDQKLNPGRKYGDKVNIQYKTDAGWQVMEIEPPMWVTDQAQAYKKTLVRRTYDALPKTKRQQEIDAKINEAFSTASEEINIDQQMNQNVNITDDDLSDNQEEVFDEYEEVKSDDVKEYDINKIPNVDGETF